jgi:hypothetical protein
MCAIQPAHLIGLHYLNTDLLTPSKSTLYFADSFGTSFNEPAQHRLLTICTTLTSSEHKMWIPKKLHCRDRESDTEYTDLKANKK